MSPKRTAATAPVLRRITAEAVLQALVSGDELTAGDLMSATGLSRPTVHSVCDELIGRGWVTETGAAPAPASVGERTAIQVAASTGGRPSRRYALNAGAGLVAGIDLGATKISCCLADLRGRIVVETTEPWRDEHVGAPERIMIARRIMKELLAEAGGIPAGCWPRGWPFRPRSQTTAMRWPLSPICQAWQPWTCARRCGRTSTGRCWWTTTRTWP